MTSPTSSAGNSLPPSPNLPYRGGLKGKELAVLMEYAWPVGGGGVVRCRRHSSQEEVGLLVRTFQGWRIIHNIHYYNHRTTRHKVICLHHIVNL